MVFQRTSVFPWMSVRDNLRVPGTSLAGLADDAVDGALTEFGLEGFADAWPKQLSGGMLRRLELARATLRAPEALLLDEPFSALDPATRSEMHSLVSNIRSRQGVTMVLVTHDPDEAVSLSNRVVILSDPIVHQIALLLSVVAIAVGWLVVSRLIPPDDRFAWRDLVLEHWRHRAALQPYLDQRWLWLAVHRYHLWFALAALPGTLAIGIVQTIDRRTPWALLSAPLGWAGGCLIGLWLYTSFLADSPVLAVMLPAILAYLGGAVAARLGAWPRRYTYLRGTRMRGAANRVRSRLIADLTDRVALAGVRLTPEDETMHIAAIGATGSGKSTALRALISDALHRGDRQVVADPEGSALSVFYQPGDIILNPYDVRCARWDLLSEIEQVGDFAMVAQSLLPHLEHGDHDQWISYAQQFLASAMESWVVNRMPPTKLRRCAGSFLAG